MYLYIILYLYLVLMGLRGGCWVGAAGCMWIGGCSMLHGVWVALELSCLATLLSLELEGSREGILYDEI